MTDVFAPYETGLTRLLERLGSDHPRYADALVYQQRLQENITQARRYGDTDTLKHARAQVVDSLNRLALETVGVSVNEISGALEEGPRALSPSLAGWAVDNRSGGVYFEGEGPVHIEGDVVGGDQTKIGHETHFRGPITSPVHTGNGDIFFQTGTNQPLSSRRASIRRPHIILIIVSTVIAAILGIASNIVAAYLQDQFNLLNDRGRFMVVIAVFAVTLAIGTWLAVKRSQRSS